MKQAIALVRLMRLYYSLPLAGGLIVIFAYVRAGDLAPVATEAVMGFFSLFAAIAGGYVLNDICDVRVDAVNSPRRVLVRGQVPIGFARGLAVVMFAVSMLLAGFVSFWFFMLVCAVIALLIVYDLYSKRMGIFKDVLVAVLTVSLYPLAFSLGPAVESVRLKALWIFPVWLFLTTVGYEMLKDIRDIRGDGQVCMSAAKLRQSRAFLYTARGILVLAGAVSVLPSLLGYCQGLYLACSVAALVLAVLSAFGPPRASIRFIYAEVVVVTAGSMADLLLFGP